jgi:hypothetical protein
MLAVGSAVTPEDLASSVNYFIQGNAEEQHCQVSGAATLLLNASHVEKEKHSENYSYRRCIRRRSHCPPLAQQASQAQSRPGWGSKVHVFAADYYVQYHGNSNANPDFQLGGRER